jgi:hypothetical protein
MYVAVRGWLEFDHKQRQPGEQIIARYNGNDCAGGWTFPARPFNWTFYVFFGGDIRSPNGRGWSL